MSAIDLSTIHRHNQNQSRDSHSSRSQYVREERHHTGLALAVLLDDPVSDKNGSVLPRQIQAEGEEQVCFGMVWSLAIPRSSEVNSYQILDLTITTHGGSVIDVESTTPILVPANHGRTAKVNSGQNGVEFGALTEEQTTVLTSIAEAPGMEVQYILTSSSMLSSSSLSAIIYGPLEAFYEIGIYLAERELFLQDPYKCNRKVPYRNPHRLTGLNEKATMTADLQRCETNIETAHKTLGEPIDALKAFESRQSIQEAPTPKCLKSALYR